MFAITSSCRPFEGHVLGSFGATVVVHRPEDSAGRFGDKLLSRLAEGARRAIGRFRHRSWIGIRCCDLVCKTFSRIGTAAIPNQRGHNSQSAEVSRHRIGSI